MEEYKESPEDLHFQEPNDSAVTPVCCSHSPNSCSNFKSLDNSCIFCCVTTALLNLGELLIRVVDLQGYRVLFSVLQERG